MRRLLVLALAIVGALGLAACGGSDAPSGDDRAFGKAVSDESSHISGYLSELVACGEDPDCLAEVGSRARAQADASIAAVEARLEPIRGTCYGDAGEDYVRFFRAFKASAVLAAQRDASGLVEAQSRLGSLSTAATKKLSECAGPNEGLDAANDVQEVSLEINRVANQLSACADFTCVSEQASALEDATRRGVAILDKAAETNDRPCIQEWAAAYRRAMIAYQYGAVALQEGDVDSAAPHFQEGRTQEADALAAVSGCSP